MTKTTRKGLLKAGVVTVKADLDLVEPDGTQREGYFCSVLLEKINIDFDYQRDEEVAHVGLLGKNFRVRAVPRLKLSFRDGKLWAYDTQHSIANLIAKGYRQFDADVLVGLTPEQEAELFETINDKRRNVNGWAKIKAALFRRDPAVVEAFRCINKYKLTTKLTGQLVQKEEADITCADVIRRTCRLRNTSKDGTSVMEMICKLIAACWKNGKGVTGRTEPSAKTSEFVRGLIKFLRDHMNYLPDNTIMIVFSKISVAEIDEQAKKKTIKHKINSKQYYDTFVEIFGTNNPKTRRKAA